MTTGREIGRACVMFQLRRAARLTSRFYEEALQPVGLTAGQFSILAALLGDRPRPLGVLAERLGMDRTTLSRNLGPLERRGLVASSPAAADKRTRAIGLTGAGRETMARALPLWRAAQEAVLARLPAGRWPEIRDDLARLGRPALNRGTRTRPPSGGGGQGKAWWPGPASSWNCYAAARWKALSFANVSTSLTRARDRSIEC